MEMHGFARNANTSIKGPLKRCPNGQKDKVQIENKTASFKRDDITVVPTKHIFITPLLLPPAPPLILMASPFSSSEIDDSAIDAIIAEATDICTLEQVAALNTAHLSDSSLPINLETRFQKLKSFPEATNPHPTIPSEEKENTPKCLNRSESDPNPSEDPKTDQPKIKEQKPRPGSSSVGSPRGSPSPPRQFRQICCFSFSPKRIQKRGSSGDEILSEFGSSPLRKHRHKLKKAWKEHEKASREADKMVKWVKQVSARINEAAIDELLKEEFK